MELQNVLHCLEKEKACYTEYKNEIQNLTQAYEKDTEVLPETRCLSEIFNLYLSYFSISDHLCHHNKKSKLLLSNVFVNFYFWHYVLIYFST